MQNLISAAKSMLPESHQVATHATPVFEDLFPSDGGSDLDAGFVAPRRTAKQVAAIYHSSGEFSSELCLFGFI